MKTIYSNI